MKTLKNNTMTSREIAEITGKTHAHIMRDIRNMEPAWEKVNQSKFGFDNYVDTKGEKRPQYLLTKKECLYVATKFNDEARAKLINRWDSLEKQAQPLDLSDADTLLMVAHNYKEEQIRRIEAERRALEANEEVEHLTPKAQLMDKVMDTDRMVDIGQTAKVLGLPYGRNKLFEKLRGLGILFQGRTSKRAYRNEPKQQYVDAGYFVLKQKYIERDNNGGFVILKVLVTQKGLDFIAKQVGAVQRSRQLALIE